MPLGDRTRPCWTIEDLEAKWIVRTFEEAVRRGQAQDPRELGIRPGLSRDPDWSTETDFFGPT